MSRFEGAAARLRSLLRSRAADERMEAEFRFHVEMQTEKNLALGMAPAEARRRARLEFGGAERHREAMRDERRTRLLGELSQDTRFTFRSLGNSRGFAVMAVLVIALGVGATTALFSVANTLLFRAPPVGSPDELYVLQEVRDGATSSGPEGNRIPYTRYEAYRSGSTDVFTGLAAHVFRGFSMRDEGGAIPVQGSTTSGNYFEVLGLRPALGRFYTTDDAPAVVLSHRFWQRQFGGADDVVGTVIHLDGRPYEIVAVAPRGFDATTVGYATALWMPFQATGDVSVSERVGMIGRLRPGLSSEAAAAPLSFLATRIPPDEPQTTVERAYLAPLTGLPEEALGMVRGFMGMLLTAGFLVLLIAAANIAALLLARGVVRQREIAVRLALGASRPRIVRQLLTESTALFLMGGVGGIAVAWIATALLSRISLPGLPVVIDVAPDLRVLAFALGVAAMTGLVFGLAPAVAAVRPDLTGSLKDGAASGGTVRTRGRSIFVGAQLALAMLLLVTAGLFVRGLQRGLAVDPGFRADGVIIGTFNLEPHGYEAAEGSAAQQDLLRRVRALPAVQAAGLARTVMMVGNQNSTEVHSVGSNPVAVHTQQNTVDDGYFETLGIELVAGRGFTPADDEASTPVVVINETLAERLWPGQNPIGQTLRRGPTEYEVIGVTRNGRYVTPHEQPRAFAFYAAAQDYAPTMTLHARAGGDTDAVIRDLRAELRGVDPDVALEFAMPLSRMIDFTMLPYRFAAALVGLFGLLGLVLAAAGIYGVVAFQVAQRMREFGIRIALGARSGDLIRLVLRRGTTIAIAGTITGAILAAALTRLLTGMLFGLPPLDPVTFGSVAIILTVTAVIASWIPARRALRIHPAEALKGR